VKFGLTLPFKTSKIELSNFVLDVSKFSTGIFSENFNFARGKGTALSVLQLPVNAAGVILCFFENLAIYFVQLLTAYVLLCQHPSFSESAIH
jgi:hypothetical protein